MNTIITRSLQDKNLEYLGAIPGKLLDETEQKVIAWIFKYHHDFHVTPPVERLEKAFPFFISIPSDLPLGDVFEQDLNDRKCEYANAMLSDMQTIIRDTGQLPIDQLRQLVATVGEQESGLERFSTFNRDRYARPTGGLSTNFKLIDRAIGRIQNGDFMLMVGRLGAGKTTVTQFIAHHWWSTDKRLLYISNEMMPVDVFSRFDGMVGHFNPLALRESASDPRIISTLKTVRHIAASSKGEILIPKNRLMTPASVGALAASLDIDAIVIDGVHLMQPDIPVAAKWERVAAVSNAIKQMALQLQRPIIGVSQLKRVGDKDEFDTEDIAYSDALGQDSDFIIALKPSKTEKRRIELQMIKNRYGPLMTVQAYVNFDTMTVTDESFGAVED